MLRLTLATLLAAIAFLAPSLAEPRGGPMVPGVGSPMAPSGRSGGPGGSGGGSSGGGTDLLDFSVAANSQYFGVIGP